MSTTLLWMLKTHINVIMLHIVILYFARMEQECAIIKIIMFNSDLDYVACQHYYEAY